MNEKSKLSNSSNRGIILVGKKKKKKDLYKCSGMILFSVYSCVSPPPTPAITGAATTFRPLQAEARAAPGLRGARNKTTNS